MKLPRNFRRMKGALTLSTLHICNDISVIGCYGNKAAITGVPVIWPEDDFVLNGSSRSSSESCYEGIGEDSPSPAKKSVCDIRGGHGVSPDVASILSSDDGPYGIHLNGWKIILQLILTLINVVSWYVPLQHKAITENKLGLSLANAFSGGVFLSLAFGHLIPEAVHGFEEILSSSPKKNDSLPYIIVLGGYLLIFFVDKVAFDMHIFADMHETQHHGNVGTIESIVHRDEKQANAVEDVPSGGDAPPPPVISTRSSFMLLAALGLHCVLEMMALGLAHNFADCFLLFLSIALHQPAESIALLVSFLKSGLPKKQIIQFLSAFSVLGPLGVFLGMFVKNYASPFLDACMVAVVAGTFVYVGATEIIPEEWEDSENKWIKFVALLSGIITIFTITQYTVTLTA